MVSSPQQYSPEVPFESSPVCAVAGLPGRAPVDRRRVVIDTPSDCREGNVGDQAKGDDDDPGFASTRSVGVGDRQADWHRPRDGAEMFEVQGYAPSSLNPIQWEAPMKPR